MSDRKEIDVAIGRYLEKVAAQLHALPPDEKDTVLSDIESHVYAALEKVGPSPTSADLTLVLAQMDPPSAWAESVRTQATYPPRDDTATPPAAPAPSKPQPQLSPPLPPPPQASSHRISLLAVAAGLMATLTFLSVPAFFLFAAFVGRRVSEHSAAAVSDTSVVLAYTQAYFLPVVSMPKIILLAGLWVTLAALTTALGLLAVSSIRASRGRLSGLPIAVGCAVFFPVAAMDIFLVAAGLLSIRFLSAHAIFQPRLPVAAVVLIAVVTVALVLFVSIWTVKKTFRWANRPLATGEFA